MGKIYTKNNINSGDWQLDTTGITSDVNNLYFYFTDDSESDIKFSDFKFGYELKTQDDMILQYGIFPKPGKIYNTTSADLYIQSDQLNTQSNESYTLLLWSVNDKKRSEQEFNIDVPLPYKEYDSWIWNDQDKKFEPPVPIPDDDESTYEWDEESVSWKFRAPE